MKKLFCLLLLLVVLMMQTVWAQDPINIKGIAIDSKGVPLPDGKKNITFNVYGSPYF